MLVWLFFQQSSGACFTRDNTMSNKNYTIPMYSYSCLLLCFPCSILPLLILLIVVSLFSQNHSTICGCSNICLFLFLFVPSFPLFISLIPNTLIVVSLSSQDCRAICGCSLAKNNRNNQNNSGVCFSGDNHNTKSR